MRIIFIILLIGIIHLAKAHSSIIRQDIPLKIIPTYTSAKALGQDLYPIKDRITGCVFYSIQKDVEIEWDGICENGYLQGQGQLNIFSDNKLVYISRCTMKNGLIDGSFFDSSLIGKYTVQGNQTNGIYNGTIIHRYYNRNIKSKVIEYKTGLKDGKQTFFMDCDTCTQPYLHKAEQYFKNDKLIAKDNFYQYLSNGKIIIQTVDESGALLPLPVTFITPGDFKISGNYSKEKLQFIGDVSIEWEDGKKYIGGYVNNKMNGQGTYTYPDGRKYVGGWKDGMQNGQGIFFFSNGEKYEGGFKDGKSEGQGTYTFSDGGNYIGEWKDGRRNGQGTLTMSNGQKYVGEWIEGDQNGQGTYTYPDGEKYIGGWRDGQRNGQGTLTMSNGHKYVGEWRDGMKNGQGTYTFPNGSKYIGGFLDDNYHGEGTLTKTDGSKYIGEWRGDKKEGQGTMTFPSGSKYKVYEGGWKEDNLYGRGLLTMSDGTKIQLLDGNPLTESSSSSSDRANRLIDGLGIRDEWEKAKNQIRASISGEKFNIKDCMFCHGTGIVKICPICRKLGRVNCKKCEGRGFGERGRACVYCSGTGIVKCNSCQGKIYDIKCSHNIWQFQQ